MWTELATWGQAAGAAAGYLIAALLGLAGLALSAVTLSGTWLVWLSALLLAWLRWPDFPGAWTLGVFFLLCLLVEAAEWGAGYWGVQRRGGSAAAGVAAMLGGFAGLFLGLLIPVPVLGSLLGMTAGSFLLAYAVERRRLRADAPALHVAWGTVTSRVLILLLKVTVTLGMMCALWFGLLWA